MTFQKILIYILIAIIAIAAVVSIIYTIKTFMQRKKQVEFTLPQLDEEKKEEIIRKSVSYGIQEVNDKSVDQIINSIDTNNLNDLSDEYIDIITAEPAKSATHLPKSIIKETEFLVYEPKPEIEYQTIKENISSSPKDEDFDDMMKELEDYE